VARATHAVSIVGLSVNLHILIGVAKGPLRRGARLEAIGPIAESPVLSVRIVHAVGRTQQGISNARKSGPECQNSACCGTNATRYF